MGLATRKRSKLLIIVVATFLLLYLCYLLVTPVFPALVWGITGAVITQRYWRWLQGRIQRPGLRAGIATASVALALFLPLALLSGYAAMQIGETIGGWENPENLARWQQQITQHPRLAGLWQRAQQFGIGGEAREFIGRVRDTAMTVLSGSIYTAIQTLLALFVLFFLYRDQDKVLESVRRLSPLHHDETDELLQRLADTVNATILGIVAVSLLQGALGGIMFAFLGIPAAVFWGIVMGVLAIIPYLGAFVIWAPAAVILASQGSWGKALVLVLWGTIVIGLIDNILYPILVGGRLRQHTLVAFIAIVGGVAVIGATGIVLGPVIVTATLFLLDIWRQRTAHGMAAEQA